MGWRQGHLFSHVLSLGSPVFLTTGLVLVCFPREVHTSGQGCGYLAQVWVSPEGHSQLTCYNIQEGAGQAIPGSGTPPHTLSLAAVQTRLLPWPQVAIDATQIVTALVAMQSWIPTWPDHRPSPEPQTSTHTSSAVPGP